MKRHSIVVLTVLLLAALLITPSSAAQRHRANFSSWLESLDVLAEMGAFSGGIGGGQIDNATCTVVGNPAANIDLSCDDTISPEDETPIVVDPNNPNHLLAGSNDYFISFTGSTIHARVPTGFFVSFDGGQTWIDGQIPMGNGANGGNGDPSPAFNAKFGTAHMAQLSAGCGNTYCGHISVSVSTSHDGGRSWDQPVTVAQGSGSLTPSASGIFNDKEWIVADNYPASPHYGRLYLTYSRFLLSGGAFLESPIYFSYSDDAGKTWTTPKEISGANPTYCTFQADGPAGKCDEDEFSTPVVLHDGAVVVHFENEQNSAAWESPGELENQTMVVRSTDGGATWSNPIHIADLEDSGIEGVAFRDYPANADARGTQTGHQFRTQSVQGMTVDPSTGTLYAFWTDNQDGVHDVDNPVTQTNVFMTKSTDGGLTWQGPLRVTSGPGDRWMAWGAAANGVVKVMYMDGSYDYPNRDLYGITLATSTNGGNSWSFERVDTAPSDPDHSIWFRAGVTGCEECSRFIGDYNGLAIDSLGRSHVIWADMRRTATVPELGRTGKPGDVDYARR
jgi:hypothetical protein